MDPIVLLKIRFRVRDGLSSELAEHAQSPKFGPSPARAGHGACLQSHHLRSQGREVVSSRPVWDTLDLISKTETTKHRIRFVWGSEFLIQITYPTQDLFFTFGDFH